MKRFFGVFVLTSPEQRVVIVLVLLLVLGAWFKHQRDLQNVLPARPTPTASPSPTEHRHSACAPSGHSVRC